MKAYWIAPGTNGTGAELRETPTPEPKAGEVLVRVRATSLNRGELLGIGSRVPLQSCLPDHKGDDRALHSHAARTADFPFCAPNPPINRAKTRARVRFVDLRVAC